MVTAPNVSAFRHIESTGIWDFRPPASKEGM